MATTPESVEDDPAILTIQELRDVFHRANQSARPFALVSLCFIGLTFAEIVNLRICDLDTARRRLKYWRNGEKNTPIPSSVVASLETVINKKGPNAAPVEMIFWERGSAAVAEAALRAEIAEIFKAAGATRRYLGPDSLRITGAQPLSYFWHSLERHNWGGLW